MTTNPTIPIGLISRMSTRRLAEILARPNLDDTTAEFILDELDARKYADPYEDTPCLDTSFHDFEMQGVR